MSDNEHTPSSLGNCSGKAVHSHVLSVKHSVGEPIPEFAQAPEKGTKVPSFSRRQDAGDVFPKEPGGLIAVSNGKIGEGEIPARVSQALTKSSDRKTLAGRSSNENIDSCIRPILELRHVAKVGHMRVVMRQDGAGKLLDFSERERLPSERVPSNRRRLDAAAYGEVFHGSSLTMWKVWTFTARSASWHGLQSQV
jgi:hypothetical protein